jgi:septum formation protein
MHLILASASPRRKELLEQAGIQLTISIGNYDETPLLKKYTHIKEEDQMTPYELTKILALEKAKTVAPKFPESTILAADTIGFLEGRILGKANTSEEAKQMILSLSGRTHSVITGYAIISTGSFSEGLGLATAFKSEATETEVENQSEKACHPKVFTRAIESLVTFRHITEEEADDYIATNEWKDKSCCYAIQGEAKKLIKKHKGSLENIIGLPIKKVLQDLEKISSQSY